MAFVLRVTEPFGSRAAGDTISDEKEIDEVLKGSNRGFVVRVAKSDEPQAPPSDPELDPKKK